MMNETEVETAMSATATAIPNTMRAVVARRYGTPDVIEIEEVDVPRPGPGEVLIQVEASSLNALDWHFLTGTPYLIRPTSGLIRPKRLIPGADVSGTIVAVGAGVTAFQLGDAVFGQCKGGCSPYLVTAAVNLVLKPDTVSFEAAASIPVAGLTAIQGLRTHGATQPGEHVLINGAAGGVGTFAVQIALALGAEVTAVCSTRNVEMVAALGATNVIDYTSDDFVQGGARFDVMLDNVGNRAPKENLSVLNPNGRYVAVSGPKKNPWLGPLPYIARTALTFRRASASFHQFVASPNRDDLEFLGELLASGQVTPQIQRRIGLDAVADGLAEIGTGHTQAKIVVVPT
jgi:NADPH:quinone reductase-like Zn-dependent oxidoreductase